MFAFFNPLCSILSQASQQGISASYWYLFCSFMFAFMYVFYSFWFAFSSLLFSLLSKPSQSVSHPSQAPATTPASHLSQLFFAPLCLIFCMFFTHFCSLFMFTSQPAISATYEYVFCSFMFAFCIFLFTFFKPFMFTSQPAIQPPPFSTQLHLPFLTPHSPFSLYRFITSTHYFFNPTITCL